MARMLGKNYKIPGPCWCLDCSGPAVKGRAAEDREWRREWDAEQDFNHEVDNLWVPGWCPIIGLCPEWCAHSGVCC